VGRVRALATSFFGWRQRRASPRSPRLPPAELAPASGTFADRHRRPSALSGSVSPSPAAEQEREGDRFGDVAGVSKLFVGVGHCVMIAEMREHSKNRQRPAAGMADRLWEVADMVEVLEIWGGYSLRGNDDAANCIFLCGRIGSGLAELRLCTSSRSGNLPAIPRLVCRSRLSGRCPEPSR
jgi:hypothetical protein